MKKAITFLLALVLLSGAFCAGYRHCFLSMLRNGRYYVDGEMLIIDFLGEYNEVYIDEWENLLDKYAQG